MRAIFLILIVAVVALIIAVQTGLIDISQTRGASAPTLSANENGVHRDRRADPEFDVQTGSVGVGSREANVAVPTAQGRAGQSPTSTCRCSKCARRPQTSPCADDQLDQLRPSPSMTAGRG